MKIIIIALRIFFNLATIGLVISLCFWAMFDFKGIFFLSFEQTIMVIQSFTVIIFASGWAIETLKKNI